MRNVNVLFLPVIILNYCIKIQSLVRFSFAIPMGKAFIAKWIPNFFQTLLFVFLYMTMLGILYMPYEWYVARLLTMGDIHYRYSHRMLVTLTQTNVSTWLSQKWSGANKGPISKCSTCRGNNIFAPSANSNCEWFLSVLLDKLKSKNTGSHSSLGGIESHLHSIYRVHK